MRSFAFLCIPCFIAMTACGERRDFTIRDFTVTDASSWAMEGKEYEGSFLIEKNSGWLFAANEPDWAATHLSFTHGSQRLEVPSTIARRIANPTDLRFTVDDRHPPEVIVTLRGGVGVGCHTVRLYYTQGKLRKADADFHESHQPISIYP